MVGRLRPSDEQLKDTLENSVIVEVAGEMVKPCPIIYDKTK